MAKRSFMTVILTVKDEPTLFELPVGSQAVAVNFSQVMHAVEVTLCLLPEVQEKTALYMRVIQDGAHFDDEVYDSYVGSAGRYHVIAMTKDEET